MVSSNRGLILGTFEERKRQRMIPGGISFTLQLLSDLLHYC